jgi:hypothetical protein
MTAALSIKSVRFVALQTLSLLMVLSFVYGAFVTPAKAAGFTEAQIQAVLNLLVAFEVDSVTIANTEIALRAGQVFGASDEMRAEAVSAIPPAVSQQNLPTKPVVVITKEPEPGVQKKSESVAAVVKDSVPVVQNENAYANRDSPEPAATSPNKKMGVAVHAQNFVPVPIVTIPNGEDYLFGGAMVASAIMSVSVMPFEILTDVLADIFLAAGIGR